MDEEIIEKLEKVLRYIEENIRVTEQTTIEYLDPKGHINRLSAKQNQIIFGRRGSGKSLLMKSIRSTSSNVHCFTVNLDDFKDVSFPDSLIQVLRIVVKQLKAATNKSFRFWHLRRMLRGRKLSAQLTKYLDDLEQRLQDPDEFDESQRKQISEKIAGDSEANFAGSKMKISGESGEESERSRTISINKLNVLRNELTDFKEIVQDLAEFLNKDFFLIFDDFYFLKKSDQPYFIDFFHRISKNTRLFLKVATIKHRSSLYIQGETYIGMEVGHDGQDLNLDYSLENFEAMVNFMRELLYHVNDKTGVELDYEKVITPNAFRFLCLASGGVPRDFFSLFITLGNKILSGQKSITKPNVIESSIENLPNKLEALKTDTKEEKDILEHYLQFIRREIVETNRWNSFLVSNSDLPNYPQINQAIKELVDLRLLHLANSNTSKAQSDGSRYSAYMVDIGLFPNANPRNFKQVQPGQKDLEGRSDQIRSAPVINLHDFDEFIANLKLKKELTITN